MRWDMCVDRMFSIIYRLSLKFRVRLVEEKGLRMADSSTNEIFVRDLERQQAK